MGMQVLYVRSCLVFRQLDRDSLLIFGYLIDISKTIYIHIHRKALTYHGYDSRYPFEHCGIHTDMKFLIN